MTQAEQNKQAMDAIFALEDSKELFEAIGGLNDDQAIGAQAPDDTEYGVDDMLTVVPGSTDPFAGQSITTQQEPSDEEKRFVIDQFAEQMAKAHKTIVDKDAIDTFAPIIQDKVSMNVNQFLTDVQNAATQRLSSQNVSDAQPSGATPEETLALADQQQGDGMDAGMDPNAAMGTPAMEPAPGGLAPEPSLDANVGDPMGADMAAAPTDDLGLGGIDDMGDGLDDFGAEPAEGGDDLGLDGITDDAGAEGDLGGEEVPAEGGDELGLDGITDDAGAEDDIGGKEAPAEDDLGSEEAPAEGGEDDVLGGDSNLDSLDDSQFGDDEEEETDPEFEAEMAENRAILESIHAKYVDDTARENVRSLVESYIRKNKEMKAQMEAETAAATTAVPAEPAPAAPAAEPAKPAVEPEAKPAAVDEKPAAEECAQQLQESVAAEKRDELGEKVVSLVEAAEEKSKAETILENATRAFAQAKQRKAKADANKQLKATLESISANFHASMKREREAKKALNESVAAPKKTTLEQKLADIVASVK